VFASAWPSSRQLTLGFENHARARGDKMTDPEELVQIENGLPWKSHPARK
jgi:hypothetical protein